jgi:hypothetical protein
MMLTQEFSLPAVINPRLVLKEPQIGFEEYFFVNGGQESILILGNVFGAEKTVVDVCVEFMYQLLNGETAFVKSSLVESAVLVGVGGVVAVGDHGVVVLVLWSDVELLEISAVPVPSNRWANIEREAEKAGMSLKYFKQILDKESRQPAEADDAEMKVKDEGLNKINKMKRKYLWI